jgi:hypothetical protein
MGRIDAVSRSVSVSTSVSTSAPASVSESVSIDGPLETLHRLGARTMIVVAGTKRSGTSLWMQILHRAGYRYIGDKFPRNWEDKLKAANPNGFYESLFRQGVNFQTNPHPRTGKYLRPEQSRDLLVKVFPGGVARSDIAFLDKVVVTIRPWRSVVRSLRAMQKLESEVWGWDKLPKTPLYPIPEVEWVVENFLMARDLRLRAYPNVVHSHAHLMNAPAQTIRTVVEFLGGPTEKVPELAEQIDTRLNRSGKKALDPSHVFDDSIVAGLDQWMTNVEAGRWNDVDGLQGLEEAWKFIHREQLIGRALPWDDPLVAGTA